MPGKKVQQNQKHPAAAVSALYLHEDQMADTQPGCTITAPAGMRLREGGGAGSAAAWPGSTGQPCVFSSQSSLCRRDLWLKDGTGIILGLRFFLSL